MSGWVWIEQSVVIAELDEAEFAGWLRAHVEARR